MPAQRARARVRLPPITPRFLSAAPPKDLPVSVPTAELTAPAVAAPRRAPTAALARHFAGTRLYLVLTALALLLAAFSLLIPSTPSYDPWAWLVWGREIVHLNLHTTGGPTWKPLPVIFTTLFAPFGKAAPDLWLVVARAGALMAAAMVFKVSWRLTQVLGSRLVDADADAGAGAGARRRILLGPALLAGVIAAVSLVFSGGFISDNALGYSEGLMTALVLIAVDRHLDGNYRQAFAVAFAAALDRPEIWIFWGPYGLWLWWKDPGARKLVIALFALIPVLWFLPEYWGSGHFLRGVNRAQHPRSNSPAFASCPFCTELADHAWPTVLLRVKVVAALALGAAGFILWRGLRSAGGWRLTSPREHALAGLITAGLLGVGWWVLIGIMTQAGFSGNNRYLVLGAALIEIAGGVGWGWAALELGGAARRFGRSPSGRAERLPALATVWSAVAVLGVCFALIPSWVANNMIDVPRTHRALVYQAHLREDMAAAVSRLGGRANVLRCGRVMTEGFQVPMLAWTLGVHTLAVQASPLNDRRPGSAPNVIFQTRAQRHSSLLPRVRDWPNVHYTLVAHVRSFRVYSSCAGKVAL
jgi:hypothetical protein